MTLADIADEKLTYSNVGNVVLSNYFLALLTPGASGGAIAQVMFMKKAGVSVPKATVIIFVRTIMSIIFLFFLVPIIFYYDHALIGWLPTSVLVIFAFLFISLPLLSIFLMTTRYPEYWLGKITKNLSDNTQRAIFLWYRDFRQAAFLIGHNPFRILKAFIESGLSLLCIYSVVPVLFSGFGLKIPICITMSALTRISMNDHKKVGIIPGDTVIISATPIPGNEKGVFRTIDNLYKQGAEVIYEKSMGVHVSGHASQEEIKMMHNLVRPKFFMPVHGEYRHLIKHKQLALSLGMPKENIVIAENGSVVELTPNSICLNGKVTAGKVLVDGLGVGDVGNVVLRDRRQLSQDGILIVVVSVDKATRSVVAGPDIVSRGFVYVRESEDLIDTAKERVIIALNRCHDNNITEWAALKSAVRDALGRYLYEKTRRRPMILPLIMEV